MGCASSKTAEDKADESKPNRKSNINKASSGSNGNELTPLYQCLSFEANFLKGKSPKKLT